MTVTATVCADLRVFSHLTILPIQKKKTVRILSVDSKLIRETTTFTLDEDEFVPQYGRFETAVSTTKMYGTVSSDFFYADKIVICETALIKPN